MVGDDASLVLDLPDVPLADPVVRGAGGGEGPGGEPGGSGGLVEVVGDGGPPVAVREAFLARAESLRAEGRVVEAVRVMAEYQSVLQVRARWEMGQAEGTFVDTGLRESRAVPASVVEGRVLEAVTGVLESFPELRESAGGRAVGELLSVLSPAQRIKFDALLAESGLDAGGVVRDGTLERALARHEGVLRDLIPLEFPSVPRSEPAINPDTLPGTGRTVTEPLPDNASALSDGTSVLSDGSGTSVSSDGSDASVLSDGSGGSVRGEVPLVAPEVRVLEAVTRVLESFPELRGSAGEVPAERLLEGLSPSQRVKFDALLAEVAGDAPALVRDGTVERVLAEHGGTVNDLLRTATPDNTTDTTDTLDTADTVDTVDPVDAAGVDASADPVVMLEERLARLREGDVPGGDVEDSVGGGVDGSGRVVDGVVGSGELEARALSVGMLPDEVVGYRERFETALAKGDVEAAAAISAKRAAHITELDAARSELVARRTAEGAEGVPSVVEGVRARAVEAGMPERVWEGVERLVSEALVEGRLADAQGLIRERNQMIERLEADAEAGVLAGDGALGERVARLRETRDLPDLDLDLNLDLDGLSGDAASGPVSERSESEVGELLDSGGEVPRGRLPVDGGDVSMVEALVVQSRTARLPEADIAVWRDRIAEAFARGSEGGAELREAGRAWQKQIDEAAGLMGAGPDELLDNVSEGSLTPQESLARAAEEAGMAKADLVEWVREIRDAWGQGRNDDAAELVDAFWNTIEEVSAQTAAEQAQARQAELMERMAGLKDMTLEEYTAFKTRQDTAEQTLKDQLRTLTDDTPAGPGVLRESLRQAVENMPADATGTL
ncbi:hypothetical protein ACFXMU_41005, partial [Streptomyces sp. NPDC059185]